MSGYPQDLLSNRSIVKRDSFAIITPQGRVINTIPGIVGAKMTILCTPKMGAGFVQLIGTLGPDAHTDYPYATAAHEESFLYVLDGDIELDVTVGEETRRLTQGGYAYAPAGVGIGFKNANDQEGRILLYKQAYIEHPKGLKPWTVFGNINEVPFRDYDEMANVHVKDFLPLDEAFDMATLTFSPLIRVLATTSVKRTFRNTALISMKAKAPTSSTTTGTSRRRRTSSEWGAFSVQGRRAAARSPTSIRRIAQPARK